MIEFLMDNPRLVLMTALGFGLAAGVLITGLVEERRRERYRKMRKSASRELARMAEQDWAEQTGVEPKCPCGAWEVCEGCDLVQKHREPKEPIRFMVGHYYRHTTGDEIAILCIADTTMYGRTLIAESNREGNLIPVSRDETAAVNWSEITKEDWMKNFS